MHTVTVIMPVYNNMPYLRYAINSVIKQSFKNWKMIISDDKSNDKSIEYLKTIKHKKIKIYYQKKNLGIFGNLNFLNLKVKTSIVKILCADDKLNINNLEDTILFMNKFKSCKLLTCFDQNYKFVSTKDRPSYTFKYHNRFGNKYYIKFSPKSSMIALLVFGNIPGNLSQITYKKIHNNNPIFNQRYPYAGDYNAWSRMAKIYGFYLIKKNLVYIRNHPKRASYSLNKYMDLFPQLSKIYTFLIKNINKKHHKYLIKYILIENLPSRLSRFVSCLISGKFGLANKVFANLPFNIPILQFIFYCISYKFKKKTLDNYYGNYIINIIKNYNMATKCK